jgi:hypothetical protein
MMQNVWKVGLEVRMTMMMMMTRMTKVGNGMKRVESEPGSEDIDDDGDND